MVAYLEKTDGNTEFHQIMDFLTRSSIYYALTVSPIVSTSFVEQFWTTAKSRTVNNISYIDATVAGKPVTISEASIRSDLLFDDADGIDSLNNQAIFDNIQLMGFISIFLGKQLKDVPVPLDHFPITALTSKRMRVRLQKDHLNPNPYLLLLTQRFLVGIMEVIVQAKEIKALKAQVKKLKKGAKPLITHHKTWMKSVAMNTRLSRKTSLKKKGVQKESVSKQGRKSIKYFKGEPYVHKDLSFEDLDDLVDVDDTLDYMETKDALDEEGTSSVVLEEKESADKEVSTEAHVSTIKSDEGTDKERNEVLNKPRWKRPRPTLTRSVLTLKPLPKIDLKDKGKKMIDEEGESDTESDDITEAEKKFKMLAKDEEVARKVQEEWEAEEEKKRLAEEEATKAALTNEYDFIQARINADKILAEEL
ncbi:hypothetical protein Tco_0404697 [Tanacetum coccineum]